MLSIKTHRLPGLPAIYYVGPKMDQGPKPTWIYLSISGEDSLALDPFNHPVLPFLNTDARVVSFDLPYHEEGHDKREGVIKWGKAMERGEDCLTPFIDMVAEATERLVGEELATPDRIAIGGLSRGGFLATHIAARSPLLENVVAFAPMTKLSFSQSFETLRDDPKVAALNLESIITQLVGKKVRYYIGNRDLLVSTDLCYQFVRDLTEANIEAGYRSAPVELIIAPSIGYKGHGTPQSQFEHGAQWIMEQLSITQEAA